MSEVTIEVAGCQAITVRVDPNLMYGRDIAGQPALCLPLELQLLPAGQHGDVQYTLVRFAGTLQNPPLGEFAIFELSPLAIVPIPTPYFRQQSAIVVLDRQRTRRFEDARSGEDARFQLMLSGLVWYPTELKFEAVYSRGNLDVAVPRSQWVNKVISAWNISNIKVVEIEFPTSAAGEHFRAAYERVQEAEKLYANGQYKQVLVTLRLSFEALAISLGFGRRVRDCFESIFASSHPDKKEKARDALTGTYRFLHLGAHEQANDTEAGGQAVVSRHDARFALTTAYAVFEYITPNA